MKKLIAAIAACLIAASALASCSDPLADSNSSDAKSTSSKTSSSASSKSSSAPKKAKEYADSFAGLKSYMQDKGVLTADSEELKKNTNDTKLPDIDGVDYKYGYEYIGAETGEKYTVNGVVIELYEFKDAENNDTIKSVKENDVITLFDKQVQAYLACDGKYMMIYTDKNVKDNDNSSDAYKKMSAAIKAFEAFSPVK